MIRKKLMITGNIGDGGIRYFAQMTASSLKLTGIAKRGEAGAINLELQGEEENIEKFIEKLKLGNGFFKVENIESESMDLVSSERMFLVK
ncbi:acylphosphatase [Clostridium hydrogeniformans]|uniref:acylphosphatase n=1 Tax=Clostridium hydrogeniformans TaxID=349933 RepID=UPI000555B80B|nr:acylphosphatase [Clostridium hydrogeniformans]